MIIGYARVSTTEQNIERQDEALKNMGCEKVFIDKVSGKTLARENFQLMMETVKEGDTLIVSEYNRLSRSTKDLLDTIEKLNAKGVVVKSIKENLDTSTPQGKLMLTIFAGLAEFERTLMLQRQAEGIAIAKEKGVYKGGTKKKINQALFDENYLLYEAGKITAVQFAKNIEVSRSKLYNLLAEMKEA